jgi:hypothetical protein
MPCHVFLDRVGSKRFPNAQERFEEDGSFLEETPESLGRVII